MTDHAARRTMLEVAELWEQMARLSVKNLYEAKIKPLNNVSEDVALLRVCRSQGRDPEPRLIAARRSSGPPALGRR
jgi:hypothetical protein